MTINYVWNYGTYPHPVELTLDLDRANACIKFYKDLVRPTKPYYRYISVDPCFDITRKLALLLKEDAVKYNYNPLQAIGNALNFVRSIAYKNDIDVQKLDHYVQYPAETILLGSGDCEDLALLYGAILSHWCVESLLVDIPGTYSLPGHLAVAINTATFTTTCRENSYYYDIDGQRYYYCEATGPQLRDSSNPVPVIDIGNRPELAKLPTGQYDVATFYRNPLTCSEPLVPPALQQAAAAATSTADKKSEEDKYVVARGNIKMQCVSADEASQSQECKPPQEIYLRKKETLAKLDLFNFGIMKIIRKR